MPFHHVLQQCLTASATLSAGRVIPITFPSNSLPFIYLQSFSSSAFLSKDSLKTSTTLPTITMAGVFI